MTKNISKMTYFLLTILILCHRYLCARQLNKESDCMTVTGGDSGGPLLRKKTELVGKTLIEKWELLGVVSAGDGNCLTEELPVTLFTNVQTHFNWIYNMIHQQDLGGRFCAFDDTIDCDSCDDGYTLEGRSCVENFGIDHLSSLEDFFGGNYCSDNCAEVMYCDDNSSNGTEPIFNSCYCTNGIAKKRCSKVGKGVIESCHPEKCYDNFRYNSLTGTCESFEFKGAIFRRFWLSVVSTRVL